jgi:hypothetical protein
LADVVISELVNRFCSLPLEFDNSCIAKGAQLARNKRLTQACHLRNIADLHLTLTQGMNDLLARDISHGFTEICLHLKN